jgi:hypothetical protein
MSNRTFTPILSQPCAADQHPTAFILDRIMALTPKEKACALSFLVGYLAGSSKPADVAALEAALRSAKGDGIGLGNS